RYLVDASGQATFMGKHLGLRKVHPSHRRIACFSHFENVERRPGPEGGFIVIVVSDEGWFWLIPLDETRTSVGVVMDADQAKRIGVPSEQLLSWALAPVIAGHLQRHYAFGRGIAAKRLLRVVAYVDENLDGQIGVEEMSSVACLSTHHFSRMFRRSMGMTPHDFVTQRRIARARELLATTQLPLQDIAGRVGYQTQAHFTRAFGEATGTTPMRYRRDQRGEQAAKPH
ncbi:MAG TPA: helix-turn-helix domain-containing protein, partial [Usitatibacter sp.]|nr:helix-turn-helix domain-containing protein [Usitatibacter sp.]